MSKEQRVKIGAVVCCSVGRVVVSDTTGLRFKSGHQRNEKTFTLSTVLK